MNNHPATATLTRLVLAALLLVIAFPVLGADSLTDAFKQGDVGFELRYRLETVDQDTFAKDATASTLRARLNYKTADYEGLSFLVEFDYVAEAFIDDYNAGSGNTPNRSQYPVVADPSGPDLNQVFLQYKNNETQFRMGRQRIVLDNARFVGDVGWRQNPQTYDAFSFQSNSKAGIQLDLAYVLNANRIFGDDVPAGDHRQDTFLINAGKNFKGTGKLSGYVYSIDNEDSPGFSTETIGARYAGAVKSGEHDFGYTFESARQRDNSNNPVSFEADYYRIDLSAKLGVATLYGGFESLQGDHRMAGKSFRTPLATLHAFNGWADMFLATPNAGLNDSFVGVKGKSGAWSWDVLYHDFSAESGRGDFGSEIDASLSRKIREDFGLLFKTARFESDRSAYSDTTKFWVQLTATF